MTAEEVLAISDKATPLQNKIIEAANNGDTHIIVRRDAIPIEGFKILEQKGYIVDIQPKGMIRVAWKPEYKYRN